MASNENEERFQCSKCDHFLDLASKTFPCLHSFCGPCVEMIVGENGLCPQCQNHVTGDKLRLAPFLVKALTVHHLESCEWSCEFCSEDGIESAGQIWCYDCQKFLCQNCNRIHKKCQSTHNWEELSGLARAEVIRVITTDECRQHRKSKDCFCKRCNLCLCDACYEDHVTASPQCPPRPLSVREEAYKEKVRGPTLERELREFEFRIRVANEQTRQSIDQLSTDCDAECLNVWHDFEVFIEKARRKLSELCDNMRQATSERTRKWRHSLKERDDLLKKVKIWRHTLGRLLRDDAEDGDVVCGLKLAGAELSSRIRQSFAPAEKEHFVVTFSKWCHDSLESLKKEMIYWTAVGSGHLVLERDCRLKRLNQFDIISAIVIDDEDNHFFVGEYYGKSIKEFDESAEMVGECRLMDGDEVFSPWDMCHLPEDILVVCCPRGSGMVANVKGGRLFFLARQKSLPFLKIQKVIDTKEKAFFSLCQIDKKIFACDFDFKEIVCFNENGDELKTIKIEGPVGYYPRLRADPTTGNLWGTAGGTTDIFVFNENGQNIKTFGIETSVFDLCSDQFGFFYVLTEEGIFSVSPKKVLVKFSAFSNFPRSFVSHQKLYVSLLNDGKHLLKILKIN